jgi:hypothetical protein
MEWQKAEPAKLRFALILNLAVKGSYALGGGVKPERVGFEYRVDVSGTDSRTSKVVAGFSAAGGAATTKKIVDRELPSPNEEIRQMVPGEVFSVGHILSQTGTTSCVCEADSTGSEEAGLSAQTIHRPLRDSGTSSSNVASRRIMTGAKTMPQPNLLVK